MGDILSYGKSTVSFLAPLITSTVGRATGAGATATGFGATAAAGRGALRRGELGAAFGAELDTTPGSGTIIARSPRSKLFLLAPEVCSSAWSTELRITSWSLPSLEASASFSAC